MAFERIAVLPFQQIALEDPHGGPVRCPLCGAMFSGARADGSPERVIENLFLKHLERIGTKSRILSGERVAGIYRRISAESLKAPLDQILCTAGRELGAEGIVVGHVYRYREREGEPFAVVKPASVAYEIHLIRVEDGALVWREVFDQTQRSLMEDLLHASSWKWITAEELASGGLERVLRTFPCLP